MSRPRRSRLLLVTALCSVVVVAGGVFTGLKLGGGVEQTGPSGSTEVTVAAGMEAIAACSNVEDRYTCLYNAAGSVDVSDIAAVDRFFSTVDNDVLGPHCYAAAETIGRNVFAKHGFDARTLGLPACETGFQHGIMIAAAGSGVALDDVAHACHEAVAASRTPERWTPSMMLTCLVGVGRGVATKVSTITDGKDVCEQILAFDKTEEDGKRKGIDFCVRGVVNDLLTVESDVQSSIDECVALGGTRAYGCLSLGLRKPASATEEKNLQLARACRDMEGDYKRYCEFALSDAIAERLTITRQPVAPEALSICSSSDGCPGHYAKFILTVSWDPQYALEACSLLGERGDQVCRTSVPDLVEAMIRQGHLPADKSMAGTSSQKD